MEWWKKAVIYHIYPLSFMDANGDGFGDLRGIIDRLDYLQWLGVDTLWISPIYPSPFYDNGYDIKDYQNIDPRFGTMQDFDELLESCHSRGMKVLLDYVSNHTSDEHPWFKESRSSKTNRKRDWYLWEDPNPYGGPPNNWLSTFGESGWEFDEQTQQYYYHSFLKQQPDLNWRNEEAQEALFNVMRFWLEKGVDGFRVDVIWYLLKDKLLRNNPLNSNYQWHMPSFYKYNPCFSTDQPEVMGIVSKMRSLVEEYGEKVLLGEVYLPPDQLVKYYGMEQPGAHLPGNYLLIVEEWKPIKIYEGLCNYAASLPNCAWPNWVLSNHDHSRIASRVGTRQAYVAALLMLTSRGTPIIYYGDEMGMKDVAIAKEEVKDLAEPPRDPQRTPMQWSSLSQAGFTEGTPWLQVADNFEKVNVEEQKKDPHSLLHLYKTLIALRKKEPVLIDGDYIPVDLQGEIFGFIRSQQTEESKFLILCNLSHKPGIFEIPEYFKIKGKVIYSTEPERKDNHIEKRIRLASDEALIAKLEN